MPIDPETGAFRPAESQRTLPPDDADISEAAELSEADADRGRDFWRANAPEDRTGLVDAEPDPPADE